MFTCKTDFHKFCKSAVIFVTNLPFNQVNNDENIIYEERMRIIAGTPQVLS